MAALKPRLCLVSTFGLLMSLYAISSPQPAVAQTANSDQAYRETTSSLGEQPGAPARPVAYGLRSGNIRAKVTVLRGGRAFPAGGSAFARVELASTGKSRTGARLVLATETAVIRNVFGTAIQSGEGEKVRIVDVRKLSKDKPRILTIELGLRSGENLPESSGARDTLAITLRAPGAKEAAVDLDWHVKDCAAAFYAEILKVREGSGSGISSALKASRTRDKSRPGRWLFPPRRLAASTRGKCLRSVRRWSRRHGRHIYICTKRAVVDPETAASPVRWERSIYRFAAPLVRARARDRELMPNRDSGWATTRVSKNMQYYLKQDPNPAICTGPIKMFDYFGKRMTGFAKRAGRYDEMARKSLSLAGLRTKEAVDAAKDDTGGHPGWGNAPLDLPQRDERTTLKTMVGSLAQLTGDASLAQRVANADNTFAALRIMSRFLKTNAGKSLAEDVRKSVRKALSAIEAADYIGTVARHYSDLRHALTGSMATLRRAHARHCTCDG